MDSGAVLDELLERHRAFTASAPQHTALDKTHRRRSSTATAAPPPKILDVIERGGNPYVLGVHAHAVESAARERVKKKRRAVAAAAGTPGPNTGRGREEGPASHEKAASPAPETRKAPSASPAVPSAKATQQARGQAASATLSSRYGELRARRLQEEEARKRHRAGSESGSSAAPVQHSHAPHRRAVDGGAVPQRARLDDAPPRQTRRDVWRRRCTARKIRRLTRGVSRAAGLRRYWYATLRGVNTLAAQPSPRRSPCDNEEAASACVPARATQPLQSVLDAADVTQRRCARRRMRAARRGLHGALPSVTAEEERKSGPAADETATSAKDGPDGALAAPAVSSALPAKRASKEPARRPSSRRVRQSLLRSALSAATTMMWDVAARVLAERRTSMAQLRAACTPPLSVEASTRVKGTRCGVLPLLLARHFPLFGALVEVQELEWTPHRTRHTRSTRHTRRARRTAALTSDSDGTGARSQLRARQRCCGIIMEEYSESVGILLLSQAEQVQALSESSRGGAGPDFSNLAVVVTSTPCVVRVPKHFPGASGSFAELLQLMLRAAAPTLTPAAAASKVRVLACVFAGEVGETSRDEASVATAYPLHRLLHRCL